MPIKYTHNHGLRISLKSAISALHGRSILDARYLRGFRSCAISVHMLGGKILEKCGNREKSSENEETVEESRETW